METANDCITKHGKALPGTADRNKHYKLQVIEKLTNIVMNKFNEDIFPWHRLQKRFIQCLLSSFIG